MDSPPSFCFLASRDAHFAGTVLCDILLFHPWRIPCPHFHAHCHCWPHSVWLPQFSPSKRLRQSSPAKFRWLSRRQSRESHSLNKRTKALNQVGSPNPAPCPKSRLTC